jgi:hypothetical protein
VQGAALAVLAFVFVLAWLVLRPVVLRAVGAARGDPASPAAPVMVIVVLTATAIVVWIANPYAAALIVPAAHVWLLALGPGSRLPRPAAVALVLAGLAPLAIALVVVAHALGLGLETAAWTATLLVAGGHIGPLAVLLWSVTGGCAAAALLIAARGQDPSVAAADGTPITVRGPHSYAGPGSLGGTDSALRR